MVDYLEDPAIKPGPRPGNPPPRNSVQPITGNGRPKETVSSPGQVPTPPPIPTAGFRIPWYGMHDQARPQPVAEIGKVSYNPSTGEFWEG